MSQNVEVCLPLFFNRTLTYKALVPVQIGQIVEVPVKEKILRTGLTQIVLNLKIRANNYKNSSKKSFSICFRVLFL